MHDDHENLDELDNADALLDDSIFDDAEPHDDDADDLDPAAIDEDEMLEEEEEILDELDALAEEEEDDGFDFGYGEEDDF